MTIFLLLQSNISLESFTTDRLIMTCFLSFSYTCDSFKLKLVHFENKHKLNITHFEYR